MNSDCNFKYYHRPPKYKTVEELQTKISEYFENPPRTREVVIGKGDNQEIVELPIVTVTGLALFLGFESRQSFYDYEKKDRFSYTMKKARTFIEREYEEQLQVGNTVGAIFALKNFGWIDKPEDKQDRRLDDLLEKLSEVK